MAKISRRSVLAGAALPLLGAALGCSRRDDRAVPRSPTSSRGEPLPASPEVPQAPQVTTRLPTLFVPHGGGPWPFVEMSAFPASAMGGLRGYLSGLPEALPSAPRALLVISAHWEEERPTLQTAASPPMLYDYYGFPPESYEITWPAPGSPAIATEVRAALAEAGIESAEDDQRGFDHGTFVVTKLMYPEPRIPTLQLSLTADLDASRALRIGRALAPLRDRGVLILGSGFSYHNMRGFGAAMRGDPAPGEASRAFDAWLAETVGKEAAARETRLAEWSRAPSARACHPREEHLLPLMVCAGAGFEDPGTVPFREPVMGVSTLAAQFG